ncbi:MAG: serine/threonine protein kinase [Deltaproteobacteria bacterium]|nr:serine/threonine protein kinase [Deltaproteobacteria bacterium]
MYARRYRLEELIGRGGMAEVFRARMYGKDGFEKLVCIKRILPEQSSNPGFEAMFRDEARLAALLRHANIVQVFDFDRDEEGRLFISMEFVEGVNLKRFLVALREKGIEPEYEVTAAIARGVLEGLHHAGTALHEGRPLRVIHRDISPHNILLSTSGEIKIADFGIAKAFISSVHTREGVVKGKATYMSPEQAAGARLDVRTDLYSLGVILWETMAGRRLFGGRKGQPWIALLPENRIAPKIASEKPGAPRGLAGLVDALLEVDRSLRPPDASAALEMLAGSGVVPAFSHKLERLVRQTLPPTIHDPALGPTEPQDDEAPTVKDDSPPEPLDSNDILTRPAIPRDETPPAVSRDAHPLPERRPGRRPLLIASATLVGALLALMLVLLVLRSLQGGRQVDERPAGEPRAAADRPPERPAIAGAHGADEAPAEQPEVREGGEDAASMKPAAGKGRLDINARPWARVFLDGKDVGYTPLILKRVPAGRHVLRLVNPDLGKERKIGVKVKPGTVRKIAVDFTDPSSL